MSAGATPETAPIGRRERRKLEVRTRVIEAARPLFLTKGFDATTVDEIAEAADIAPATFFNHFHSKQALLGLMATEVVRELASLTDAHLEGADSAAQRLQSFVAAAADRIQASRDVARLVVLEFMRIDGTPYAPHPYLGRIHQPLVALIGEGQREGEFRTDHDATFLAQMAMGMLNAAITSWLADPDYPVERGLATAAEFVLDVFQPRPSPSAP